MPLSEKKIVSTEHGFLQNESEQVSVHLRTYLKVNCDLKLTTYPPLCKPNVCVHLGNTPQQPSVK